ncbi:ribosome maturation factor RimM [Roseiterribacter gracilis]|uniref:Ribosome maturation factor RimM n=1 Tax=Roseiterribacter gracilis TaxID=2812848 RepID=A0A8S8XCE4_9PROT|nr:ribosome maturation factor RimM [Rhodospirillales bacterium TMPK1]
MRFCVGAFAGAHGVRGLVKLKSFTGEPDAILRYRPLTDEVGGREFQVTLVSTAKDCFVVKVDGVTTREGAEALASVRVYAPRAALPATEEDEFYHADLIGLAAETTDGAPLGQVAGLYDFGAGDVLEIAVPGGKPLLVPFTRAAVPQVDMAGKRVVIDLPVEA